jgi:hypothetical protein
MCGRYRLSRRKAGRRGILRLLFRRTRLGSALQHRSHPARPRHPPESEGTLPRIVPDALGTDSLLVKRCLWCRPHDQCAFGNSGHEACVPRCIEISQVPDSCRWFLRMEARREKQAALLLSRLTKGSCLPSRASGIAGKTPAATGSKTCSILTTTPNAVTSAVHDRMPAILDPDAYDLWLDPGMNDVAAVSELLKPFDARMMRCYPVSTRINSVVNDDEECSKPVELVQVQDRLFV